MIPQTYIKRCSKVQSKTSMSGFPRRSPKGVTVEIISEDKTTDTIEITSEETDEVLEITQDTMSYVVKIIKDKGVPRIFNIPPEEFLINEGATSINGDQLTRFVAHRQMSYVADVMENVP